MKGCVAFWVLHVAKLVENLNYVWKKKKTDNKQFEQTSQILNDM